MSYSVIALENIISTLSNNKVFKRLICSLYGENGFASVIDQVIVALEYISKENPDRQVLLKIKEYYTIRGYFSE